MQTNVTSYNTFSIREVENSLSKTRIELIEFSQLQGQQDGLKEPITTANAYKVKILDHVQATIQHLIDFIKQTTLITAHILHVKELETTTGQQCEHLQLTVDDLMHQVQALIRKQVDLSVDPFKLKYGKWLTPVALFVGACDGIGAYISFRSASFSTVLALISSIAIALVISTTHFLYAGWILSSSVEKTLKLTIVKRFKLSRHNALN